MKTTEHIHAFLDAFVNWASGQKDVQGIALCNDEPLPAVGEMNESQRARLSAWRYGRGRSGPLTLGVVVG